MAWPEGTSESAFGAVNAAAAALMYGEKHAADPDLFGDNIASLIERGRDVSGTEVAAAFRFADACARTVVQFFTEYDYLLTPTTACVSRPIEQVYPKVIENREVGPARHLGSLRRGPRWSAGGPADRGAAPARPPVARDGAAGGDGARLTILGLASPWASTCEQSGFSLSHHRSYLPTEVSHEEDSTS